MIFFILRSWQEQSNREQVIWIEARINRLQSHKAPDHKPGPYEQHKSKGDFCNNEDIAYSVGGPAPGPSFPTLFQGLIQVYPRVVQRRDKTTNDPHRIPVTSGYLNRAEIQ